MLLAYLFLSGLFMYIQRYIFCSVSTILYLMTLQILYLAFLLVLSQAWWDKGHMLVAQVAYDHLTARNSIGARDRFDALIKAFVNLTDGRSDTFMQSAVWADDIKQKGATMFSNYHFTNMYLSLLNIDHMILIIFSKE